MDSSVAKGVVNREVQLDFVRGIAIIAVMVYHFKMFPTSDMVLQAMEVPLKSFGQEGVNLFFTLSGFLVGGLLFKSLIMNDRIYAVNFIIRRAFKIWPAYYFLILFHFLVCRHAPDTFLFQNLVHLQNYLGTSIKQTWSLAVEEHFYLFLPPFLMLTWGRFKDPKKVLIAIAAVILVVLVARSIAVYQGYFQAAFFHTQFRIDSLLMGVALAAIYWFYPARYEAISSRRSVLVAIVVATIVWILAFKNTPEVDLSVGYTIQALGFCALIMLVKEHSGNIKHARVYRFVSWIGVYSYGTYLWHSLALGPAAIAIGFLERWSFNSQAAWVLVLAMQFTIAIILGYITTKAIEWPFLKLRERLVPAIRHGISKESSALPIIESASERR